MNKFLLSAVAASAAFGVSAANAVVLDFAAAADIDERALDLVASPNLTLAGVNMRITASSADADGVTYAYLDANGGQGPAGLGVCQDVDGANECFPGNDDNIGSDFNTVTPETATITFLDGAFNINGLSFRGEGHVDFNGNNTNTLLIKLNAGAFIEYTFAGAVAAAIANTFAGATSIAFRFGGANPDQFYVNAITGPDPVIPVPAALPLLLSGLAGLGFASRKKKSA